MDSLLFRVAIIFLMWAGGLFVGWLQSKGGVICIRGAKLPTKYFKPIAIIWSIGCFGLLLYSLFHFFAK